MRGIVGNLISIAQSLKAMYLIIFLIGTVALVSIVIYSTDTQDMVQRLQNTLNACPRGSISDSQVNASKN